MQTDEEVGKVAAAVPVIICILDVKTCRLFVPFVWAYDITLSVFEPSDRRFFCVIVM